MSSHALRLLVALLLVLAAAHPAQDAQRDAMRLANDGKMPEALPFFKRACK